MGTRKVSITPWKVLLWGILFLCACATPLASQAQVIEVPIYLQVPLAVKSLAYSKSLPTKLKDGRLVIGICYQENNRRSYQQMEELNAAFAKEQFSVPIRIQKVALDDQGTPVRPMAWGTLSCIYLTTLQGVSPARLLAQSRDHAVISFSTDPTAVLTHVAVAFELVGGRAKFAINLANSEKENCEFSSQLLKLAKIY